MATSLLFLGVLPSQRMFIMRPKRMQRWNSVVIMILGRIQARRTGGLGSSNGDVSTGCCITIVCSRNFIIDSPYTNPILSAWVLLVMPEVSIVYMHGCESGKGHTNQRTEAARWVIAIHNPSTNCGHVTIFHTHLIAEVAVFPAFTFVEIVGHSSSLIFIFRIVAITNVRIAPSASR